MSSQDEFTADYSLTKPAASVTLADYHAMLDRVDAHLVGRGPVADRPADMSTDAIWVVTEGDGSTPDNSITRYDSAASEWVEVGPDLSDVLGSESSPLSAVHSDLVDAGDLDVAGQATLPLFSGADINTSSAAKWYKIGQLTGSGANCKVIITENSRTGRTHETGMETCAFKNGNSVGEHGGYWYQMAPSNGRILEGDFGYVQTGDLEMDIYYKAASFTQSSAIVLDGDGFTHDFRSVGTTEPTDIVYLDSLFPVASPAEFANGIENGLDVSGAITQNTDPVATVPFVNTNTVQESTSWDGNSITLETGSGDTIEFISEN